MPDPALRSAATANSAADIAQRSAAHDPSSSTSYAPHVASRTFQGKLQPLLNAGDHPSLLPGLNPTTDPPNPPSNASTAGQSSAPYALSADIFSRLPSLQKERPGVESEIDPEKVRAQGSKLRSTLNAAAAASGMTTAEYCQKLDDECAEYKDTENSVTKKKRMQLLQAWVAFVGYRLGLSDEEASVVAWHQDTVNRLAIHFLRYKADSTPGRGAKSAEERHVKAITLRGWFITMLRNIILFTTDDNGNKVGAHLLTAKGLYTKMNKEVHSLIKTRNLDRCRNPVQWFGRQEAALMFEYGHQQAVRSPATALHVSAVDASIAICMYTGMRPGSLNPSHPDYEKEQKFFKLKHLKITRLKRMCFRSALDIRNFKAYNDCNGKQVVFALISPEKAHNVQFDANIYVLKYLLGRGVLYYKASHPNESTEILIRPECLEEPLLPRFSSGGREILLPMRPQSASQMSASIARRAMDCGLPRAGVAAFRRGFGNEMGILDSRESGAFLLAHMNQSRTFDTFYSKGAENYNTVGVRTGEVAPLNPRAAEIMAEENKARAAVQLIIRRNEIQKRLQEPTNTRNEAPEDACDQGEHEEDHCLAVNGKVQLGPARREEIEKTPALQDALYRRDVAWESIKMMVKPKPDMKEFNTRRLNIIYNNPQKYVPQWSVEAMNQLKDEVNIAEKTARETRRHLTRQATRVLETKVANQQAEIKPDRLHTMDARDDAIAEMSAPSTYVAGIVRDVAKRKVANEEPDSAEDLTEEQEALQEYNSLGNLFLSKVDPHRQLCQEIEEDDTGIFAADIHDGLDPETNAALDAAEDDIYDIDPVLFKIYYIQALAAPHLEWTNSTKFLSHNDQGRAVYTCDKCNATKPSYSGLKEHMRRMHHPWRAYEDQMTVPTKKKNRYNYICPVGCQQDGRPVSFTNMMDATNHATKECKNAAENRLLYEEYAASMKEVTETKRPSTQAKKKHTANKKSKQRALVDRALAFKEQILEWAEQKYIDAPHELARLIKGVKIAEELAENLQ
ncbi:hypothetical protein SISNIDRAFT_487812 [Sistotremastrum niveocremeum HHB9708]|uniref:C2H2-type domain-containing protein n=1 Tax=Sistotremastrum niveocremeum HHB9708 TaxID=1314777 RepID=A0A164S3K0_9AGAM|nr:hypothetical protein SISNIDRAFT_487812 [Sistotremastrum niveocremeum HHB9708]